MKITSTLQGAFQARLASDQQKRLLDTLLIATYYHEWSEESGRCYILRGPFKALARDVLFGTTVPVPGNTVRKPKKRKLRADGQCT